MTSIKCCYCGEKFTKWSRGKGLKEYIRHLKQHQYIEKQGKIFLKFAKIFKEKKNDTLYEVCKGLSEVCRGLNKEGFGC